MKTKYVAVLVLVACILLSFGVISKKGNKNTQADQSNSGFALQDRDQF